MPVFQRPYQWGVEHAGKLLDDLLGAVALDQPAEQTELYFLGTVLLRDAPGGVATKTITPKMAPREFDIVDGHQRLVTLMTLIAVLRDLESDPKKPVGRRARTMINALQGSRFFRTERHRLQCLPADSALYSRYLVEAGQTLQAVASDGEALSPSQDALIAMRDHFVAQLKQLTDGERALLFDYVVNRSHVVVIVNHDEDFVHNWFVVLNDRGKTLENHDILKAQVLSGIAPERAADATEIWDSASAQLGRSFDTFFAHVRAIYGHKRPRVISGIRAVISDNGGEEAFLRHVFVPLAEAYRIVRTATSGSAGLPPSVAHHLTYLNRLPDGDWAPAAMLVLKDWRHDPAGAARVIGEIDRLAHLLRLLCLGQEKRVRRFAALTAAIRAEGMIGSDHEALQISRDEARNIAFHMKDLHKRNGRACKLLLMRIADEMDGVTSINSPDTVSVEHVMPQRQSATSEWRLWYPNPEQRAEYVDNIGNLVLVSDRQNQKARNGSFAAKKAVYAQTEPGLPITAIIRDVLESEEWRPEDIMAREQRLLLMIENIWRINLGTSRAMPRNSSSARSKKVKAQFAP